MAAGVYRFATTKSPVELGAETMKLKANRMLNSVGECGRLGRGSGGVVVAGLLWEQDQGYGCCIAVDKLYRLEGRERVSSRGAAGGLAGSGSVGRAVGTCCREAGSMSTGRHYTALFVAAQRL